MKFIVTEKAKGKKYDKKRMKLYWERVFPKPYAKTLVGK